MIYIENISYLSSEILLASSAILMQIINAGTNKKFQEVGFLLTVLSVVLAILMVLNNTSGVGYINCECVLNKEYDLFDSYLIRNKIVILSCLLFVIFIYSGYTEVNDAKHKAEYNTLLIFGTIGSLVAISAKNILTLFLSLELLALSSYVLTAFDRKNYKSSEAGIKYFTIGSLSSCLMLFGMSMLYGFSGSILFDEIKSSFSSANSNHVGLLVGSIFLIVSVCFKLSVAPFHIWTPDIYEGSPSTSLIFFNSVGKLSAIIVLINIISKLIGYLEIVSVLIKIISILSILIGSIGGLRQKSIKRLMGYSTILNLGIAVSPVIIVNSSNHYELGIIYTIIYSITTTGLLSVLIGTFGAKVESLAVEDLSSLNSTHKTTSAAIAIMLFSIIGLPPFAGFFGKWIVIQDMISHEEYLMSFVIVLGSVISAYYYLNIIKSIYFGDSKDIVLAKNHSNKLSMISIILVMFIISFGGLFFN